jgi:hypothetical protein
VSPRLSDGCDGLSVPYNKQLRTGGSVWATFAICPKCVRGLVSTYSFCRLARPDPGASHSSGMVPVKLLRPLCLQHIRFTYDMSAGNELRRDAADAVKHAVAPLNAVAKPFC